MHYVYPYPHVDEVIPLMAEGKVLPYLDIPFQHASPARAEGHAPAGAPGEDAGAHPRLARDLPGPRHPLDLHRRLPRRDGRGFRRAARTGSKEAKLDRVGCFKYEPVSGAAANDLGLRQVPREVKQERWHRFMERQQAVSAQTPQGQASEGASRSSSTSPARPSRRAAASGTRRRSTGTVYVASRRPLRVGDIVTVKIERADAYDLHGVAV